MNANDPNAENRVDEVEFLRQRIKMLETELNDIRLHSAYQKQKLDELEARLRAADSTYVDHPEDESLTECSETPHKVS